MSAAALLADAQCVADAESYVRDLAEGLADDARAADREARQAAVIAEARQVYAAENRPAPGPETWRVTATTPLPVLMTALAAVGWGWLDGRAWQGVRSVLRALNDYLGHANGAGRITAGQITTNTGLSERWTRVCLHWLEDAGIITWHRGNVIDKRGQPGWITVHRGVLADMIRAARPAHDECQRARARRTRARLAAAGIVTMRNDQRYRRSARVEPETSFSPLRGSGARRRAAQHLKRSTHATTTTAKAMTDTTTCPHGAASPHHCNDCDPTEIVLELPLDPLTDYLNTHYPDATPPERARWTLRDPEAKRLAIAQSERAHD